MEAIMGMDNDFNSRFFFVLFEITYSAKYILKNSESINNRIKL